MLGWNMESQWVVSNRQDDLIDQKQSISMVHCQIDTIQHDKLSQPIIK